MWRALRSALFVTLGLVGLALPAQAQPFAYIASNIGFVFVVDTATNTVVATIPTAATLSGTAVAPDGGRVYVASRSGGSISVIDTATNTVVATVPVGRRPQGVAVAPNGVFIYVTNSEDGTVSIVDAATDTTVAAVPVGSGPHGLAITPDGARVYVPNLTSDNISVIDTATHTVLTTISAGTAPAYAAVSADGTLVYVSNNTPAGSVSVISTATNAVVATVPVGRFPQGIAVTPNGDFVYVTNTSDASLSVIDTASHLVVATVPVGASPVGVAFTPDGAFAYVGNASSRDVSVIDTATSSVVAMVPIGQTLLGFGLFIGPAPNRPPTPGNDSYSVLESTAFSGNVLTNDTDPDGDALEAFVVSGPSHGSLQLSPSGSFTYTPTSGYLGPDTFTYQASDGHASATATVAIAVSAPTCGIAVQPVSIAQPYVAIPYWQTFAASPSQKYTFSVTAGALPAGLHLWTSTQSAALFGVPTTPGPYSFTITAQKKDSACRSSRTYAGTIPKTVVPLLTCVRRITNNTYRATFGYASSMDSAVTIPVSADNAFSPSPQGRGQTTTFSPGTVVNAFSVTFTASRNDNDLAIWFLRGPDGQRRPITITRATFGCQ